MKQNRLGVFPALVASIVCFFAFSAVDALVKFLSQTYEYSSLLMGSYFRISSGVILLIVLILKSVKSKSYTPFCVKHLHSHIIRGILLAGMTVTFVYGFTLLPLNVGYSISFMLPIFTAIFGAIFLKEHISKIGIIAIFIGFAGVLIVLRPGLIPFSWGYISLFLAILIEVPFFLITRKYHRTDDPYSINFYPALIAAVLLIATMFVVGISFQIQEISHLWFFLLGGFFYVVAQVSIVYGLAKLTAQVSIGMQYTQIIWGTLFGVFLFRDTSFDVYYLTGIILVIFASYTVATGKFLFISKIKKAKPSNN